MSEINFFMQFIALIMSTCPDLTTSTS